ncbi:MAG TPA: DUF3160 domain-containing protein [Opitutaceae bacterium]|nr:DUF3160 domain-containing protein [Opitutaceae bacterium]
MPYPMRSALALSVALLLGFAATLPAAPAAEPPPEPISPKRTKEMTQAEFSAAHDRWRAAHNEWEANLTAQQYLEWRSRKSSRPRSPEEIERDQRFERGQRLPLPTDGYTWQAAAAEWKLDATTIAALAKDKIAYGPSVRQSFEPYLGGPVFITSDSILNAFHVLFEDSFRELELRRAARFRPDFEKLLASARQLAATGDVLAPERAALALQHLERVLGPALVLNGTPLDFFAAAHRAEIQAQVDRLNAATGTELPAWLAPADPASLLAIDYARCQPVGFYTAPARLAAYFRAMRWLQLVPFRASREPEFDAMVLLACAIGRNNAELSSGVMRQILGPADDPSTQDLALIFKLDDHRQMKRYDGRCPEFRRTLCRTLIDEGYYRINTDSRATSTVAGTFEHLSFRIVPQAALPDGVLFQRLLDKDQQPSGLAVAAMLGSPFAAAKLDPVSRAIVVQPLAIHGPDTRRPRTLYEKYLDTLRALFQPPTTDMPTFLQGEAWAAKSCLTALGGWAQMRHTFTLQAKLSVHALGYNELPPGFIEPNPEFYNRLSTLVEGCRSSLAAARAFETDTASEADELREVILLARKDQKEMSQPHEAPVRPAPIDFDADYNELSPEQVYRRRLDRELGAVGLRHGMKPSEKWTRERWLECLELLIPELEAKVVRMEQGTEQAASHDSGLANRWHSLSQLASRLETLSHKQLRKQPWSEDDEFFLKSYGEDLGGIHGYYSSATGMPRDDAPRWAEVSGLPEPGKFLAAGIGRPREFYVLYPWNGIEVLCVGSVMQYYEYETGERLTDDAWRALLDSPAAPPLPAWFQPYAPPPTQRVSRD